MARNGIGIEGARSLAGLLRSGLESGGSLTSLDLSGNDMGPKGAGCVGLF